MRRNPELPDRVVKEISNLKRVRYGERKGWPAVI